LTVLRLNKNLSQQTLQKLNLEFKDILISGEITESAPLEKEIREKEYLDLPRLKMHFNLHDYGRLYEMINVINSSTQA